MRPSHLVFAALLLAGTPAFAQETQPGDACAVAGRVQETGGPEQAPSRVLICDGAIWKVINERTNDGKSLFQVGNDVGSCSAEKQGRLRYISASDDWEYCTGSAWSPFESTSGNCTEIGNVCSADGTVYIGNSPLDGAPMYTTRCDHGRSWDGMRCTGLPTKPCWDDCQSDHVQTGLAYNTDAFDGHFNTAALATNIDANASIGGFQNHAAAKLCQDLAAHGHNDWFMPAPSEMQIIAAAHTLIGDIDRTGYPYAQYWVSAEAGPQDALVQEFFNVPVQSYVPKAYAGNSLLRCIRKPAATNSETAPSGCASVGNVCSDGTVYAGDHPMLSGIRLYTSIADHSAASTWASVSIDSGADSSYNGDANQRWLAHNTTLSQYPAAQVCENLGAHGHNDWYLPSRYELNRLYTNRVAISGFGTENYWSSTEASSAAARRQAFNTGLSSSVAKNSTAAVRCIRRDNFD